MPLFFCCQQQVEGNPLYRKHLPSELYNYLEEHALLDDNDHLFNNQICIKLKVVAKTERQPELLTIEINTPNDSQIHERLFAFKSGNWYFSRFIDTDGRDYVAGHKNLCPLSGFSSSECAKKTKDQVALAIVELDKVVKVIPAATNHP